MDPQEWSYRKSHYDCTLPSCAFTLGPSSVDAVPNAVESHTKIMKTASADWNMDLPSMKHLFIHNHKGLQGPANG
jgi:hypothetical protein